MANTNQEKLPEKTRTKPMTLAEKVKASDGFTLDEIRYQRALLTLQKEFVGEKIANRVGRLRGLKNSDEGGKRISPLMRIAGLSGKAFTGIGFLDYAMIGFTAFNTIRKVYRFFRPKRH